MLNVGQLTETVQTNCNISDARHAGNYSMCIFLLKMREYYRWENQIPLSHQLEKAAVGDWMIQREQYWADIEEQPYAPLAIGRHRIDPFDADTINEALIPEGLVYSSGCGIFNKPHFMLGKLHQKRTENGVDILISSCEYARDLVAPPAMMRNQTIFIRQESLRRMLWEKIEEWQLRKDPDAPLAHALRLCDATEGNMESALDQLLVAQSRIAMLHELGESAVGELVGSAWEEMLHSLTRTKAEMQIRAVRDHLADCLSTLPELVAHIDPLSLHVYFANFSGIRKDLFTEAFTAYTHWLTTNNLDALNDIIIRGESLWRNRAHKILDTFNAQREDFYTKIEKILA